MISSNLLPISSPIIEDRGRLISRGRLTCIVDGEKNCRLEGEKMDGEKGEQEEETDAMYMQPSYHRGAV